jgi:valyl-tRNA synthetase
VKSLSKLSKITWQDTTESIPISASSFYMSTKISVPLKGLVDIDIESDRLNKSIAKIEKDIIKIKRKLENPSYCEKAPVNIVKSEQKKLSNFIEQQDKLKESLSLLDTIA